MFARLDYANVTFLSLFTLEIVLKMFAYGFQRYFLSKFNRFDFAVVLWSIVESVLMNTKLMPPLGLSVFRCARLLRVFKVTRCVAYYLHTHTRTESSLFSKLKA